MRLGLAGLALAFGFPGMLAAQNTDTLILENSKRFTVLDQISDRSERDAVLEIYRAHSAEEKAQRAEAFLAKYPRSWMLAEVYEIAAKAYIDLEEFGRALHYGRASLEILPENPLLLVPLANVQARRGLAAEAQQNAQDALEYLENFGRPSAISERQWPDLQKELKASCFFVLGRVKTVQAVSLPAGPEQRKELVASIRLLGEANRLNPNDQEIEYLTGLDYIASGNQGESAKWMAAAYRKEGPLKTLALAKLQRIFDQTRPHAGGDFSQFLGSLGQPDPPPAVAAAGSSSNSSDLPDYVGTSICITCHTDAYRNWTQSGMSRMLQPYRPENIVGDFVTGNVFYAGGEVTSDGTGYRFLAGNVPFARMIIDRGKHYFEIRQADRRWHRYPVDYTIGSKWQQGYVTRLPNGQLHVFPIEYNRRYQKWVNFWKLIDAPGTERDDPYNWEKYSPATSYTANCAACHTSQLRNLTGGGFEPDNLEFREPGIDCEMCHGPGGRHVTALAEGKPYPKAPLDPPVDFVRISSRDSVDICAQCHLQSAIRLPGPNGELNYSRHSDVFFTRYKSRPYAEFFLTARYKDGRFSQTSFIVESFRRSACFRRGEQPASRVTTPIPVMLPPTRLHFDSAISPTGCAFSATTNSKIRRC